MKSFFTPKEVAKLVNISYRQIQYWDKTNFIRPSYRRRGKYRLYTFSDLIQLKVARTLRDHNFSIQRLRKTVVSLKDLLPQINHPLVDLTFLIEGDRILVFNGEVLMNTTSTQNYIRFDVKTLREEINSYFPEPAIAPYHGASSGNAASGNRAYYLQNNIERISSNYFKRGQYMKDI